MCYCSHLSFLYFCFSFVSKFQSPMPSCPASPLLPLNWNQLSHSILSLSALSGLLVAVGLGSNRIYGGPIYASMFRSGFMVIWYVHRWGFVGLIDFRFCISFPEWWWWCSCGFVIWLWCLRVGVVVLGGGDSFCSFCGCGGGWMGLVSNELWVFFFFSSFGGGD